MITKTDIAINLQALLGYNNKITIEGLLTVLKPKRQKLFGFYLQEVITNNDYSLVASYDVIPPQSPLLLTVSFSTSTFKYCLSYTFNETVDKLYSLATLANHTQSLLVISPVL